MSFNFPHAIPTLIPTDTNVRATRVSTIYPTQVLGPYTTWKLPVRIATTANITLSGIQTIDGVNLVAGDRVLVKNQTTASENGIYVVISAGSITDFWLRSNDLQKGSNAANLTVFVNEGTISADIMYICTNISGSDIVGTDSLVFITYGITTITPPGGNNTDVQYNNGGVFGGSDFFTFNPDPYMFNGIAIEGAITLGSSPPNFGLLVGSSAPTSSGNTGTPILLSGGNGDGIGDGGNIAVFGGVGGLTGNGGNISVFAGSGVNGGNVQVGSGFGSTMDGDINLFANTGKIKLITNSITTYFQLGGIQFTKDTDVAMTIADLVAPPTITSIARQGIITITDPSAVGANSSITITVNDVNVLADDTIYVCVQEFNTAGDGIPMVLVSSITTSTSFTIQLYNIGALAFSASTMKISFIMM